MKVKELLGDGEEGVVEQDKWLEQEPEGQEVEREPEVQGAEVLGDRLTWLQQLTELVQQEKKGTISCG